MKRKIGLTIWLLALILVLVSCIGDASEKLEGTSWRLISYDGKAVIPGSGPTLFFEDGKIGGNASCNTFGGSYKQTGNRLEIGETFWTLMACVDDELMDQENAFMRLLSGTMNFEMNSSQLVITSESGKMMVFVPME